MPMYLIDTVSTFRLRYVIEAESVEHAMDEVVMNDADGHLREFSQKHIAENIVATREIDKVEYLRQFNEDNDYLKGWDDEQKLSFVNVIDYES